ncbi:helix-turn-helix domain-containing protein [Vagococcus xieshaowenii]|uniref:XRE family transcriptional regulator n=1 Tax=Vagococcus xieshaowenii TaxID=2562451 RepID=A0AAJ5JLL6_9ENTE|nr:helix-turn-helix transcriptional regulator [Vagococcus xieshaowenii]QCA29475.1 XRE family transcriptional regulator [Vagococcus xieshaowenii]TFZ42591.1 XRE family transcriptional regulator [Vagococcus xieshaowenii]
MLNELISSQIRIYRTARDMTLSDLSVATDIDDTYLGRIERNEINITLNTLEKIMAGLKMTPSEFFGFLDLESVDPVLSKLFREVKVSPKKTELTNIIQDIVEISKEE